ncbi:MAG: DUF1854 domain-containing protein [Armatimonadetes bacterium]|nr:DUF1854 domain-containing protein [Armatimonadota bacterium]
MTSPNDLHLFYEPEDRLRLTVGDDRSYPTVRATWAAPMSRPNRYLCLLDGKGSEIAMIEDPDSLPRLSREAVRRELRNRYLTASVQCVIECKQEFGTTYWCVETDRGVREFVTQSLQENAQWLSDTHLVLVDVDGNRFDVPDVTALDARSRKLLHAIL